MRYTHLYGLLLALLLAACGPSATTAPATTAPAATSAAVASTAPASAATVAAAATSAPVATGAVKIGLLSDQSGGLASYGSMLERGFQLGLEYATDGSMIVAGKKLSVVVKDTAGKPETGTLLARELIEKDGAQILAGVPSSAVALAVSGVAKENKIVYIAEPAASPDLTGAQFSEYTFRTSRTSVQDSLTMGAALTGMGKKFIQIAPDYAFGRGSAQAFYTVVKSSGGTFVTADNDKDFGAVYAPQDTTDFTPYLNKLIDAKADVLIVTWAGNGFVPLFQQMQQLGIFKSMVVATGMADNQALKTGFTTAIGSVGVSVYHYTLPKNKINDWLVEQHQKRFNAPPDLFTAGGFAAAQMIVEGLKKTNGDPSAAGLIKALEGLSFETPKGTFTIRPEDHVALQPLYLVKLANVTDPAFKFFELIKEFKGTETAPPCAAPKELNRCK